MNVLMWLFKNYSELIAAGTAVGEFGTWAAEQIKKLFAGGKTPEKITREDLAALAAEWPGALPVPEDVFDPILLEPDPDPDNEE